MSLATRLAARLAKVQARIAEIEAAYSTIAKFKSYSVGFGQSSASYQEFGPVGAEYARLLDQEEALQAQIEDLASAENSGSYVSEFREVQT